MGPMSLFKAQQAAASLSAARPSKNLTKTFKLMLYSVETQENGELESICVLNLLILLGSFPLRPTEQVQADGGNREDLARLLEKAGNALTVSALMQSLQQTLEFEAFLTKKYAASVRCLYTLDVSLSLIR